MKCAESWVDVALAMASGRAKQDVPKPDEVKEVYNDTGFGPIDADHRALSEGLEDFIGKVNGGRVDEVGPALAGVIAAVAAHFTHEEELMVDFSYPLMARHKEAHALFVGDALRFQAELVKTGATPNFHRWVVGRLPEWFRYHILAHDMGLGQYLSKAGVTRWRGAPPVLSRSSQVEGGGP